MKPRLCLRELTWVEPAIQSKTGTWPAVNLSKKQLTSVSSKIEPTSSPGRFSLGGTGNGPGIGRSDRHFDWLIDLTCSKIKCVFVFPKLNFSWSNTKESSNSDKQYKYLNADIRLF